MLETPDQIQTPIHVESPTPDLPAQSPEPETPAPEDAAQDETALTAEISELWRLHSDYKGSIKMQTENLRSLRAELGKRLSEMKQVLAKPGRSGGWSAWLKERQISRATADRLVLKFERSLNPAGNCLTAQFTEPTEAEIQTLLDKVAPKLRRVLRTPASAYRFVELLVSSLALDYQAREGGLLIVKPSQETGLVETVPEAQGESIESAAEPVPVIAEIQAEVDSESMGTSAAL